MANQRTALSALATALAVAIAGCASTGQGSGSGWTKLVDGVTGMENFVRVGEANWTASDGAIQASQGGTVPAFLVSKSHYKDLQIRAEFWASDDANSGAHFVAGDHPFKGVIQETGFSLFGE